jgi:anti-sigma B factor antagonist
MTIVQGKREMEVVRGPDWLFVRLRPDPERLDDVAERIWALLNKHFVYRLVLEMDEVDFMPSVLMGQLVMLQKRILEQNGALRLCGLSPQCEEALRLCRLDHALAHFDTRADAVRGSALAKPR